MLQVNSLIFPKPKRDHEHLSYMTGLWEHFVYIPKNSFRSFSSVQVKTNKVLRQKVFKNNNQIQRDQQNKDLNYFWAKKRLTITTSNIIPQTSFQNNQQSQYSTSSKQKIKPTKIAVFHPDKLLNLKRISFQENRKSQLFTCRDLHQPTKYQVDLNNKKSNIFSQNSMKIPCLFIKSNNSKNQGKILIYYHGNGQDMVSCYPFVRLISIYMNMNALIVQYPTYSIYNHRQQLIKQNQFKNSQSNSIKSTQCTQTQIQNDSIDVMQHLIKLGYQPKDIILIGRSIGTGVVVNLATIFKVRSLVLLSPFISIKATAKHLYGELAGLIIKQRFNNIQKMKYVESPVLMIHGMMDKMIPYTHTLQLSKQITSYCSVKLIPNMTHSTFHYQKDFLVYLHEFIKQISHSG